MGKIKKESSILVLGILIVEDIIAVILIASLQSIVLVGNVSYEHIITISAIAAALIIGTLTIGARIIPRLIDRVAISEHKEILLLSVLGLCFGYALLSNLVGLSVGIGAFLAGVLVAESKSADVSKILASPIKDMFAAIFFVSVGALMDISQLQNYVIIAIVLIVVSVLIKSGGTVFGGLLFRQGRKKTVRSSLAIAPRGEFSIIIVKVGVDMGAVSTFLFPLIGIISIITAFVTPFMIRAGDQIFLKTSKVPEQ
jgi:CPA2 family monovalent cation:H+ antiporter-2